MAPRPTPPVAEGLVHLAREGLGERAIWLHNATDALRRRMRTTTVVAERWLEQWALADDEPPLYLVYGKGGLTSVLRPDKSKLEGCGWKPLDVLDIGFDPTDTGTWISLDISGRQVFGFTGAETRGRTWVMTLPVLQKMAERQQEHRRSITAEQRQKTVVQAAAFHDAHPGAQAALQELLDAAGVDNMMTSVRCSYDHRNEQTLLVDGKKIGAASSATITLFGGDIDRVVALLRERGISPAQPSTKD